MRDADEYDDQDDEDDFRPSQRRHPTKGRVSDSLPVFVIIVAVMECVFVLLGLFGLVTQLIGIVSAGANGSSDYLISIVQTIVDSIMLALMVGTVIGYFSKQSWGKTLGWATVLITVLSLVVGGVVGFMRLDLILQQAQIRGQAEADMAKTIAMVSVAVIIGMRVVYLGIYAFAVNQFSKFINGRDVSAAEAD